MIGMSSVIGAPSDSETDDAVVELKCPSKETTVKNYLEGNTIKSKLKAQIQLQMFFANKAKEYFCVASPHEEKDNKLHIIVEKYDEDFTKGLLHSAMTFWEGANFPKLMRQV
ncbi:hypothetical protein QAD02_014983 [Eretmocerus hayati]|uniref:Uncharacterized protein n=1 Tax=Eretmocerus hayati TaxID=131215 RepID=A0ACC2P8L1_9HYME|nr:hypothetical protein QAD02_014983 [Eretmocerus hayati]